MKRWWQTVAKDYFTFTARERNGLLILAAIGVIAFLASRYYPLKQPEIKKDAFQKELADLKITIDSSRGSHRSYAYKDDDNEDYYRPKENYYTSNSKGDVFEFDPNTLDAAGWKRLGLRDKTINTIQNFLAKGYKFRQPDDLRKIYGLRPNDADRIIPYVRIAASGNSSSFSPGTPANTPAAPAALRVRTIDINTADTSALIALPGIGSKLAARIVTFRDRLGGFTSVNQIGETYGVPDSTFQKIKSRLVVNPAAVRKVNINTADVNQLKSHPYLKWNIANAIVNYRNQHGKFGSVNDLRKIDIITEDIFNKVAPYVEL